MSTQPNIPTAAILASTQTAVQNGYETRFILQNAGFYQLMTITAETELLSPQDAANWYEVLENKSARPADLPPATTHPVRVRLQPVQVNITNQIKPRGKG
jgi:hypothetical protein